MRTTLHVWRCPRKMAWGLCMAHAPLENSRRKAATEYPVAAAVQQQATRGRTRELCDTCLGMLPGTAPEKCDQSRSTEQKHSKENQDNSHQTEQDSCKQHSQGRHGMHQRKSVTTIRDRCNSVYMCTAGRKRTTISTRDQRA